jgi:hypothetical protein
MAIYAGSALGLLLTTSFLGLRRYLRQRKVTMPARIAASWLTLGVLFILSMLVAGALLPRPGDPNRILQWAGLNATERETSSSAMVGKGQKNKSGTKPTKGTAQEDGKEDKSKGGQTPDKDAKEDGKSDDDKKNDDHQGDGKDDDENKGSASGKGKGKGSGKQRDGKSRRNKQGDRAARKQSPSSPGMPNLGGLATVLKWIVVGIIVLAIIFFVLRGFLRFLANFTLWAQRLLDSLRKFWLRFTSWRPRRADRGEEPTVLPVTPPRPFSFYRDPFLTGRDRGMSNGELVRYSFEALEAWARERDLARQTGETPLEFAQRIGDEVPALETDARRLANFYAGLAYARGAVPNSCRDPLRDFWLLLAEVVVSPLSAGTR